MRDCSSSLLAWILGVLAFSACTPEVSETIEPEVESLSLIFRDIAVETGLDFRHYSGASGEYYLPEIMGPGVALVDYDADGDLDVYLLQGTTLGSKPKPRIKDQDGGHQLYRNDLSDSGVLTFTDVTDLAGLGGREYGMGTAVGDIDNDGDPDLYVAAFGRNVLYQNNGDGSFTDITDDAGVDDRRWSSSASFLDYDRDGNLDLFVANYVDFTLRNNDDCYGIRGMRDYCSPISYRSVPDRLFRNSGDGTYEDVSERAGIQRAFGNGLGVIASDFNADGWPDIYVANDGNANQLWQNNRDGTFSDVALLAGTAYNANGEAEAGMGVMAGDADGDGDEDLFVSHLSTETHTLYLNGGTGMFHDGTLGSGIGAASVAYTGFGCGWFDYDHDGRLDLFVANGGVIAMEQRRETSSRFAQRNQLFQNIGGGSFIEIRNGVGAALELLEVSRAAAFGDIDNDGDIDIVVTNTDGPVRLFRNEVGSSVPSLTIRLEGIESNRDALGSRVALLLSGRAPVWRSVSRDGSYLSSSDARVHFGLGNIPADLIDGVGVIWPNGLRERWEIGDLMPSPHLKEGSGSAWLEAL